MSHMKNLSCLKEKLKVEDAAFIQISNAFVFRGQFGMIEVSSTSDLTLNVCKGGEIVRKGSRNFRKKSDIFENFENFDFFDVSAKFQRKNN